ncbi:hypothetical protein [Lysinibacillus sp. NPDC047702]|uniref:hypothetical protein n=1 Tax=unclassified Lysinibacillus TaxID=2636778 RepID=UPI003CFF62BA
MSKWLMSIITVHPKLKGTSFQLATNDGHSLYAQYGFKPLGQIENRMNKPLGKLYMRVINYIQTFFNYQGQELKKVSQARIKQRESFIYLPQDAISSSFCYF